MNSSSFFTGRAFAAGLALLLLAACESTSVSFNNSAAAAQLAGKKTFRVTGPVGGDGGFRGESFSNNVTLAIIATLKELGYTPVTGEAAELSVEWSFLVTNAGNPGYFATPAQQPGGPPPTIEVVNLNIYVSAGTDGKTLWRGSSPFPTPRSQWSPGNSAALARQTLHNFPPYREAVVAPTPPAAP